MEKLVFVASIICLDYIQICSAINTESIGNLSLPVDCREDNVYPWFQGCDKFIQCKETEATIQSCQGKSNLDEKLSYICPLKTEKMNCGYINCTETTTKVVAFRSPNKPKAPFYGLCVKGIIISQGICTTENSNLTMEFDEEKGSCVPSCNDGDIIEHPDCSKWSECVDNKIIVHECPAGAYFNGLICSFNYECPTNNTSTNATTTTPPTTSSPTTPLTIASPTIMTTPPTTASPTTTTTSPTDASPTIITTPPTTASPTTTTTPPTDASSTIMTTPPTTESPTTMTAPPTTASPTTTTMPPTTASPTTMTMPPTTESSTTTTTSTTTTGPTRTTSTTAPTTTLPTTSRSRVPRTTPRRFSFFIDIL